MAPGLQAGTHLLHPLQAELMVATFADAVSVVADTVSD
jgi:hypothetical protein